MVTVTIFSDEPAAYIRPYSQTTTNKIGMSVILACLKDLKPIDRVMKTNNDPSISDDCISLCIASEATYRVTGRPVIITQVSGSSSVSSPAASCVPEDKLVKTVKSRQSSSKPSPIPGKSSGEVIPNLISIRSYSASFPLISSHGFSASSSTFGLMYNSTMLGGISGIGPTPGTPCKTKNP